MYRRRRSLLIVLASGVMYVTSSSSATFGQQVLWQKSPEKKAAITNREAILRTTNGALLALVEANQDNRDGRLRIRDVSAYVAVVHPDFLLIDSKGKVIGQAKAGGKNWANVVPLKTRAPVPGESMKLLHATSKITAVHMSSENEVVVTGEDRFHWIGMTTRSIEKRHKDGSVSVIPNTEQRYVTRTYRRRWTQGTDRKWRLKCSCQLTTDEMSTL
jgi:hypothetical protein